MIVYCCQDLLFATKIGSTAKVLGAAARPARDESALVNRLNRVDDGRLNEKVRVVMIDLEMGEAALKLLRCVKAHDATLPVVAFGSHVATDVLQAAADGGADYVMPRSQFTTQLPALIERFGKISS